MRLFVRIGHHVRGDNDWTLPLQIPLPACCGWVEAERTAALHALWHLWFRARMTLYMMPDYVLNGSVGHSGHLVLLVPRPRHVVEALVLVPLLRPNILVAVLWNCLRFLMVLVLVLVLVALEGEPAILGSEVPLALRLRVAPGDSEPAAVDGDALHLAHGHQRITTQHKLNEGAGLVGPVHVSDLAEVRKEFLELLVRHSLVDSADEQCRVVVRGCIFARLISWQP